MSMSSASLSKLHPGKTVAETQGQMQRWLLLVNYSLSFLIREWIKSLPEVVIVDLTSVAHVIYNYACWLHGNSTLEINSNSNSEIRNAHSDNELSTVRMKAHILVITDCLLSGLFTQWGNSYSGLNEMKAKYDWSHILAKLGQMREYHYILRKCDTWLSRQVTWFSLWLRHHYSLTDGFLYD